MLERLGMMDPSKGGFESSVPRSLFVPSEEGYRRTCCRRMSKCDNTFSFSLGGARCTNDVAAADQAGGLVDQCAGRITEWLYDDEYFTALPGIAGLKDLGLYHMQRLSQAYVQFSPCVLPVENYLETLFNQRNLLDPEVSTNPFRKYVFESLPPCAQLTQALPTSGEKIAAVGAAAVASFRQVCPFEINRSAYAVDQDPNYACTYDPLTDEVFFGMTNTCPEGSRCACPLIPEQQKAFRNTNIKNVLTDQLGISRSMRKLQLILPLLLFSINPLASVAYGGMIGANALALEATLRATAITASILTVIGGQLKMTSCTLRIGCFPFDCKKVQGKCRLVPQKGETDFRSLYFMVPPPLRSCNFRKEIRGCGLDVCNLKDIRMIKVGMNTSVNGKKNVSGVFNCQALAYRDMNERQEIEFAKRTKTIYDEQTTPPRLMAEARQKVLRACPWLVKSKSSNMVRCQDISSCDFITNPSCCAAVNDDSSNMDLICPDQYILCESATAQYCSKITDRADPMATCGGGGRWKPCPEEEECPFAAGFPAFGYIQCNNLEILKVSDEDTTKLGWCATRQGLRKCPAETPVMCANKDCLGEHCCASSVDGCKKMGGVRYCDAAYIPQNQTKVNNRAAYWIEIPTLPDSLTEGSKGIN